MKKAVIVVVSVSVRILFLSSSVSAQREPTQTQQKIHFVYSLISQLSKTCASPESTSQNNCNGYVYGVIDALDAGGLSCPGHPDPTYFGRRVKEDIAAFGRNNSDAISQPAGSVIASLLKSYGCLIPSGNYGSSQAEVWPGCKDAEAYKDKAPEDYRDQNTWFHIWQCEAWANENGNQKLAHDSFSALNNLYKRESSALETDPEPNAPAVCKVFQDDQQVFYDAIRAGMNSHLSETETSDKTMRAREDFRARFNWSIDERNKAVGDLIACSEWASDSHPVISLETRQLAYELIDDTNSLPGDIEKVAPVCKNASSEADAIMVFMGQHMGDTRIMPSDVEPFYERATPVMHCGEQLAKTAYRSEYEHLILAVAGINNLMVLADSNAQAKLIHALPPPQPGSPIVIKVQNSYQQNPNANHCTGTVLNLGSISSVDWNCN